MPRISYPSVGYLSPYEAKNNLQKKKSTMLPQAIIALCKSYKP
jgi:hypothetical protein